MLELPLTILPLTIGVGVGDEALTIATGVLSPPDIDAVTNTMQAISTKPTVITIIE
jgi:hypothetical protein